MKPNHIWDRDNLFRHSVYPVSFKGKRFNFGKLIGLRGPDAGPLVTSLAWQKFVPSTDYVHRYGCRLAARRNANNTAKGKDIKASRQLYCGAYALTGAAVRALACTEQLNEISNADVIHEIEDGEIAHVNLRISLKPGEYDVEGTKTAIVDRLWHAFVGPLRHRCDCDNDIEQHPSAMLDTAPGGEYSDRRSRLSRLFFLIRFRVSVWWWRRSGRDSGPMAGF